MLESACNRLRSFIIYVLLILTYSAVRRQRLLAVQSSRPVHSDIRQCIPAHSHHRYFVDPRPITRDHLWFAFAISMGCKSCRYSECVQPTSACCVSLRVLPTVSSNAVSGGAFRGVTPSFHSSEYQLGKTLLPRCFYLFAGRNPRRVYMQQRVASRRYRSPSEMKSRVFVILTMGLVNLSMVIKMIIKDYPELVSQNIIDTLKLIK